MSSNLASRKAQTFMPDYLASIVVFGLILTVFLASWNSVLDDQTEFEEEDEMRFQGTYTATFLISTPGYPENWNSSNVLIPGFAEPDHVLQAEKLEEFHDIGYDRQSRLLKAEEYYMKIYNDTGILESGGQKLEYGQNYSDAETVVPFTRTVQVNLSGRMEDAKLRYIVWN